MSKPLPPKYQTISWQAYNQSLKQRGQLLLWLNKDTDWLAPATGRRGRQPTFSDAAIQFCLTIKCLFGLALRQATGMVESMLRLAGLDWAVPDFSTLSRRQKDLQVRIPVQKKQGCLHLLVDSTGIKMMGEGEWKVKKHGADYRRQWRKLHLGIDAQTLEIRAMEVTDNRTGDATMLPELLSQIPATEGLVTVTTDGAYDTRLCHAAIAERGAAAIIPPRRNGQFWKGNSQGNQARNESLRSVKYLGRTLWKKWSGYHRRSLVETKMHCFKLLADRVKSRDFDRQVAELQICAAILNQWDGLLPPDTASTCQTGSVNKPVNRNEESTMKIMRIGIDLAKTVFQVHGVDAQEKPVCRRQLRRSQLLEFFTNREPCLIGMEACASAHHWARKLQAMGHTVKLIAPQFVKPYVKGNKNDANDAEAICEAVGRPSMRFVPVKTVEQQDLQALHRIRSELIRQRTAKVNQIRGLLGEYGIVVAQHVPALRKALPEILEDAENGLSGYFRTLLDGLRADLVYLDEQIDLLDQDMQHQASTNAQARKLQQLRGIGPITATALVAAIGQNAGQFKRGRDLAAWLGLTPAQHSSGGKDRLLGISKRGDAYLRTLLIHGARAVVRTAAGRSDRLSLWIQNLCSRRNKNVAAVALANKTARLVWALLSREADYDPAYGLGGCNAT